MKAKLTFLLLLIATYCNAQIVNIPDFYFKTKLLAASSSNFIAVVGGTFSKIDQNNDGEIQLSEAAAITYLNLNQWAFNFASALQHFVNLKYLGLSATYPEEAMDLSFFPNLEIFSLINILLPNKYNRNDDVTPSKLKITGNIL